MPFLIILGSLIALALLAALLFFIFLKPNKPREGAMQPFKDTYIAHRGLFDNETLPENSLPAFEKAVQNGYGIELDVQLTKDGKLIVFHDETMKRMSDCKKRPTDITYDELQKHKLLDTECTAPLFEGVLKLVDGKVPLIIEIKPHGPFLKTCKAIAPILDNYKGIFCVESFNPAVVRWFKNNRKDVVRGILASNYLHSKKKTLSQKILVTNLLFNGYCKPDFVAYNHEFKETSSLRLCKKLFNCSMVAWTIHSQEELDKASDFFEVFIFERFQPENK